MHPSTHHDRAPRAGVWSIGLIIIVSAVLAGAVEPLFPSSALAVHGDTPTVATEIAKKVTAIAHAVGADRQ